MFRGKRLIVIILLLSLLVVDCVFIDKAFFRDKYANEFVTEYMPNNMGVSVYEVISTNRMKCNLTTVNTMIENMIVEGYYSIIKEFSDENFLDVVLSNGDIQHRLLYNRKTRDFMSVSNPFSKNYIPQTYIHE